jgi:hypothetical protein
LIHLAKVLPLGEVQINGLGIVVISEKNHVADKLCSAKFRISAQTFLNSM